MSEAKREGQPFEMRVGVTHADPPMVAVALTHESGHYEFTPEFAVAFAQLLLKNARLAGFTGAFVELPVEFSHPIH